MLPFWLRQIRAPQGWVTAFQSTGSCQFKKHNWSRSVINFWSRDWTQTLEMTVEHLNRFVVGLYDLRSCDSCWCDSQWVWRRLHCPKSSRTGLLPRLYQERHHLQAVRTSFPHFPAAKTVLNWFGLITAAKQMLMLKWFTKHTYHSDNSYTFF